MSCVLPTTLGGGTSGDVLKWGSPTTIALVTGVLTLSKPGYYKIDSESGSTDDLTNVTGLAVGDEILIEPVIGKTITIKTGVNMQLASDFILDSPSDKMELVCQATGIMAEAGGRSNNA